MSPADSTRALLTRLLELEAQDSGIPEAEFKLGYLIGFVDSARSLASLRSEALKRIKHFEAKLAGKEAA